MMWHKITPTGVVFADVKTGTIKYANDCFLAHTGRTLKEYRKKPFIEFVHPFDRQKTINKMTEMEKGGKPAVNFKNRCMMPNGESVAVKWQGTIVRGWYLAQATFES